jgi:hypothetical protein
MSNLNMTSPINFQSDSSTTKEIINGTVSTMRRNNINNAVKHNPQIAPLLALKYAVTDALLKDIDYPAKEYLTNNAAISGYRQ